MDFLKMLEEIRTPFFDTLFGLVTRLGEETVAIVVMCAIYWCVSKKLAYGIGISYFLSGLFVQGMKISFRVDRPWVVDPAFRPVESALGHATGYSFPSGHTQGATALFGTLGFYLKKAWGKILCFLLAMLVGFSRMYLGVHTPLDVGVGFLLSILLALITVRFLMWDEYQRKREIVLMASLLAIAFAVIGLAVVLFSSGKIGEGYVIDCCKAAGAGMGFAVGMFIEKSYIRFSEKNASFGIQFLKFFLGLAGVLVIKEGLKLLIGAGIVAGIVRYFLMILWMTVFFPLIIKRFFTQKPEHEAHAS